MPKRPRRALVRQVAARALVAGLAVIATALLTATCGAERDDGAQQVEFVTDVEAGAQPGERTAARITVAAAADLRDALTALTPQLEQACATRITVTFGSSGQLARQVASGAPYALFLSADEGFALELGRAGKVAPGGLARYARGRLALVARDGLPVPQSVGDLADPVYARLAIANPEHAPYGRAALEALERSQVTETVEPRLVFGDNVRQALDYVDGGNADAGIVALSLVATREPPAFAVVDPGLHEPLSQAGVVVRDSGAELTARCLLARLLEPAAQAALSEYGFEPPVGR